MRPRDVADRLDRGGGRALHGQDLRGDLLGRLGGLHRQRLHLGGDHREAAAGLAGARRLDGGVERQQVGLAGDVADELHHVADLLRGFGQARDLLVGGFGLVHRDPHHLGGAGELLADLADRSRELGRGGRRDRDVGGGLVRCLDRALRALRGLFGRAATGRPRCDCIVLAPHRSTLLSTLSTRSRKPAIASSIVGAAAFQLLHRRCAAVRRCAVR